MTGARVTGIVQNNGGPLVSTLRGTIRAGSVVVAAGHWTMDLLRPFGAFMPLEPAKGYHVEVERKDRDPEIPVFLQEARLIATPLDDRLRFAGILELSGTSLARHQRRVDGMLHRAERIVPGVAARHVHSVWSGLRPCSPDGLPYIGRLNSAPDVVVATGHSMLGITLAPVTGTLVADTLEGSASEAPLALLAPDRFRRVSEYIRMRRPHPARRGDTASAPSSNATDD